MVPRWLALAALLACESSGLSGRGRAAAAPLPPAPSAPAPVAAPSGIDPSVGDAVAEGRNGAVSSAEGNASSVGIEVLRRGGNAVDAAVAVGFALGVTHPSAGNIGGGGFMIVRLPSGEC